MNSQHEPYIYKFQHSKLSSMFFVLLFLDFLILIEYWSICRLFLKRTKLCCAFFLGIRMNLWSWFQLVWPYMLYESQIRVALKNFATALSCDWIQDIWLYNFFRLIFSCSKHYSPSPYSEKQNAMFADYYLTCLMFCYVL